MDVDVSLIIYKMGLFRLIVNGANNIAMALNLVNKLTWFQKNCFELHLLDNLTFKPILEETMILYRS